MSGHSHVDVIGKHVSKSNVMTKEGRDHGSTMIERVPRLVGQRATFTGLAERRREPPESLWLYKRQDSPKKSAGPTFPELSTFEAKFSISITLSNVVFLLP